MDLDGKWLVLHAGASDPRRRYPIKEYAAAARELVDDGWQIVPKVMNELLNDPNPQKVRRVTEAFLPMKKLDIQQLLVAAEGK